MKYLFISLLSACIFFSCTKPEDEINLNAQLNFSSDTITFDTVFASIGSITKTLTIYNNNNFDLNSDISLKGISSANFRMNIDGVSGNNQNKVFIAKKDSIFIFIEVTVDPSSNTTPYILSDSLIFTIGNNQQSVKLIAWGQDAYFHTANTFGEIINGSDTNKIYYHQINSNETWTNDKPHVIFGYVIIEPNAQLNINPGTNIHLHKNSGIYVGNPFSSQSGGTLKVNGSYQNEVIFQGDRLDSWYENIPGQWDRIRFIPGSYDNEINYAIIKNGTTGLHADTVANSNPTVTVNNTIITNMSAIGILGQGASLNVSNTVISECGQYTVACYLGGDYIFNHCTFANYWNYDFRNTPSILLNNYYVDINDNIQIRDLNNVYFGNCIIYGSLSTEISFDENINGDFFYTFDHSLIKIDPNINTSTNNYINIIKNSDPIFIDHLQDNFNLDANSPAKNFGNFQITQNNNLSLDLAEKLRSNPPEIGAFEAED
tara:strand:+ start:15009 stop:16472 length:1464 start_codon:yes stop_codon:yes gene_type:complete